MDLSTLLTGSREELQRALEEEGELDVAVAGDARVLVERTEEGGFLGDLQVKGITVVLVRQEDHHRFQHRLAQQIAIHVPRDPQPDLADP